MTHLKYLAEGGHNMVIVDEKVGLLSDELFGKGRRPRRYEWVCDHQMASYFPLCAARIYESTMQKTRILVCHFFKFIFIDEIRST